MKGVSPDRDEPKVTHTSDEAGMFGRSEQLVITGEEGERSKRWLWIAGAVAVIVLLLILAAMAMRPKPPGPAGAPKTAAAAGGGDNSQIPTVTVSAPGRSNIENVISGTGTLAARREMPVGVAGEGGLVTRVLVEPGQWVNQGQVLATVDRSVQTQTAESLGAS